MPVGLTGLWPRNDRSRGLHSVVILPAKSDVPSLNEPRSTVASTRQRDWAPLSPVSSTALNQATPVGAEPAAVSVPTLDISGAAPTMAEAHNNHHTDPASLFSPTTAAPHPELLSSRSGSGSFDLSSRPVAGTPARTDTHAAPPTPAPPPVTPAPPRPSGEAAISHWFDESGLGEIDDLVPTLSSAGVTDLTKLAELSEAALVEALKPLKLRSLKLRKLLAAHITLQHERDAFVGGTAHARGASPDVRLLPAPLDLEAPDLADIDDDDFEPSPSKPPMPRAGERLMPRFKPRTNGRLDDAVPGTPESAAISLGLTGPSEARELGELATLLRVGRPSQRASKWEANINAGVLATSAAREAAEAKAAAEEAAAKEEATERHECALAALGEVESTPRSKKQVDKLRLVDLQTALDEAARERAAAGVDESPMRMQMNKATAPRGDDKPRKRVPRAKKPPAVPSARTTRSVATAQQRVMLPSGMTAVVTPRTD